MEPGLVETDSMLDLGSGYFLKFFSWKPDRELNPQYEGIPDMLTMGGILTCKHGKEGAIHFNHGSQFASVFGTTPLWTIELLSPLTLTPSIQTECCHGYIRNGNWEDA